MPNLWSSLDVGSPVTSGGNGGVEVTCRTLRTISHSLVVYEIVSEAYIHFAIMYTADHFFPVLPIKDLINQYGEPTTPFKLVTGTNPSVSHLRVLFCPCDVRKATAHVDKRRYICVIK